MASDETPVLGSLDLDQLRRAVAIYLEHAYPEGGMPEAVRRRVEWPAGSSLAGLVAGRPFERFHSPSEGSAGTPVYALRLGNAGYPNMKLQIQAWPCPDGYLLSVNTHDQVLARLTSPEEQEAFRTLQAENQRLKEAIEAAWDQAGFPTFLRYLRDYIDGYPAANP